MNKLCKVFNDPFIVFRFILKRLSKKIKDDETYIKWMFFFWQYRFPDLKQPKTYCEKLQWLKLHDRHDEYSKMVDKYEAKKYVANIIGEKYIIPTLGVWNEFDQIDFQKLPKEFVLKCTHDSGGLVVCRDKNSLDYQKSRCKINKCLNRNYYWECRETHYRNISPRIIAEKYMADDSGELSDYKIFCFSGKPRFIQVDYGRFSKHIRNIYSPEWELLELQNGYPRDEKVIIERPEKLDEMLYIAETLSYGFPHLRVDLYYIQGNVYFGELTFFHSGGFKKFEPIEWENKIGEWLKLPGQ